MKLSDTQQNRLPVTATDTGLNVLLINASSRLQDSVTRQLTHSIVEEIRQVHGVARLTVRDLAFAPLPFINDAWVEANFTQVTERDWHQRAVLSQSDALVEELKAADVIVLGVPIYNFSVPATLKAWIDLVARAGLTFRYTSEGPVGLLDGKQAFVAIASGGVPIDSAVDFTTPYIRHVLGFIGINDVKVIAAERMNANRKENIDKARQQIRKAVSGLNQQHTNAA